MKLFSSKTICLFSGLCLFASACALQQPPVDQDKEISSPAPAPTAAAENAPVSPASQTQAQDVQTANKNEETAAPSSVENQDTEMSRKGPPGPDKGTPQQPAAGVPVQPEPGIPNQPTAGIPNQPAAGIPNQPAAGIPNQPAAGIPVQPAAGIPNQPTAGIPNKPNTNSTPTHTGKTQKAIKVKNLPAKK